MCVTRVTCVCVFSLAVWVTLANLGGSEVTIGHLAALHCSNWSTFGHEFLSGCHSVALWIALFGIQVIGFTLTELQSKRSLGG